MVKRKRDQGRHLGFRRKLRLLLLNWSSLVDRVAVLLSTLLLRDEVPEELSGKQTISCSWREVKAFSRQ